MPGILINLNKEINSCCLPSGSGPDGIIARLKLSHITSTIFLINGHENERIKIKIDKRWWFSIDEM